MKNYQETVDEIFGPMYKHRTLRTIFDPESAEYDLTSIEEKIEILRRLLESKKIDLNSLILKYKFYYSKELKKEHVSNSIERGLIILLSEILNK